MSSSCIALSRKRKVSVLRIVELSKKYFTSYITGGLKRLFQLSMNHNLVWRLEIFTYLPLISSSVIIYFTKTKLSVKLTALTKARAEEDSNI